MSPTEVSDYYFQSTQLTDYFPFVKPEYSTARHWTIRDGASSPILLLLGLSSDLSTYAIITAIAALANENKLLSMVKTWDSSLAADLCSLLQHVRSILYSSVLL